MTERAAEEQRATKPAHRFDVQPTAGNHFSWINSRLAIERTFLAWMRTSVSLIAFGFTIVKFFQHLESIEPARKPMLGTGAPRDLGIALIAAGIGALFVASLQYHWGINYLWKPPFDSVAGFTRRQFHTPAYYAAFILGLIGLVALVSVFVRLP
jgi:putative membrane protein